MIFFALTIFLSAFLLFLVQPLIARFILPWFGGTPAVWTTCMLFFQTVLLAGYAYAHWTSTRLTSRRQVGLHWVLLAVSLVFLPIIPAAGWKPTGDEAPTARILLLLAATIGVPYLVLSTTGPLIQKWFSRTHPGLSPYRLFALSNAGSLLALLSFPLLVEPYFNSSTQAVCWSVGYGAFVALCAWCGALVIKDGLQPGRSASEFSQQTDSPDRQFSAAAGQPSDPQSQTPDDVRVQATASELGGPRSDGGKPRLFDVLMWLALAAVPSALLLAITNHICQEVAVVPFLWVLPLSLYLISFILCFESDRWYHRGVWAGLLMLTVVGVGYVSFQTPLARLLNKLHESISFIPKFTAHPPDVPIIVEAALWAWVLFLCCMIMHGELARSRPPVRWLTLFYLVVAAGGAVGGAFVVVIAPRIFDHYAEAYYALIAFVLLLLAAWYRAHDCRIVGGKPRLLWAGIVLVAAAANYGLAWQAKTYKLDMVFCMRTFYGVLTVSDETDPDGDDYFSLQHGTIQHGIQYVAPEYRRWKTSYYGPGSGVGLAIRHHPHRRGVYLAAAAVCRPISAMSGYPASVTTNLASADALRRLLNPIRPIKIGVVGLGVGTIATYGRAGDRVQFYEINAAVRGIARDSAYFTYLRDSRAKVDVVLGDARIKMEQQLAANDPQQFDVLAIDAFSSDAIPMHLLTRECFRLYWKHLKPDGILAVHVSNRHLDLRPVVFGIAEEAGCRGAIIDYDTYEHEHWQSSSRWILVTRHHALLDAPAIQRATSPWDETKPRLIWTDQYGSLLQVLK